MAALGAVAGDMDLFSACHRNKPARISSHRHAFIGYSREGIANAIRGVPDDPAKYKIPIRVPSKFRVLMGERK